jgi:formiminotetrahydrofolate cyclodeaminase
VSEDRLADRSVAGFLQILASDAPTPGGGAVAAIAGATGAALIAMVGRLTVGKPGFEQVESRMRELVALADAAVTDLEALADRDAHAFDGVMVAFKMPKDTEEQRAARSSAIQAGYRDAASVPREVARRSADLLPLAIESIGSGNPQAASDGLSAAASLHCAVLCAIANVEINAGSLKDEAARDALMAEAVDLRDRAARLLGEASESFRRRLSA